MSSISMEEIKKMLTAEDIKEIAVASGISESAVRMYLNSDVKRSRCAKYVMARYRNIQEFKF